MPALTNVDLRLEQTEEPFADAFQIRGTLTLRHGDPESPTEITMSDPTSLVELAVVVADAIAQQRAHGDLNGLSPNTLARLDRAVEVLDSATGV